MSVRSALCAALPFLFLLLGSGRFAVAADADPDRGMRALLAARPASPMPLAPLSATPCVAGMAGPYPCSNVDLRAFVPVSAFAASSTNSLWGWTDPESGIEYALVGADNGTVFYDLSNPDVPRYLGKLPTHTGSSIWRDVRVYQGHAFIVADNDGAHGMQVFDLDALRGVTTPQTFTETAHYGAFGRGHTISINESTGFASIAGSDITCPGDSHTGGLQILDIHIPDEPVFAGCVNDAGYTHESQCFVYTGPDTAHAGRDICINANGPRQKVAIVDVTDKSAPHTLASVTYDGASYPHQGWLTDDQRYLLVDDELDEQNSGHNAWTYVWDVSDLDAPVLVGHHESPLGVIDHNLYVHGQYLYQSNYEAGVRILRMDNLSQAQMTEVAFFDTFPAGNSAAFNGSWNNYRFPGSGLVIATGIDEGFFVLEPRLCDTPATPGGVVATANGDHRIDLVWNASAASGASYRVERAQGGCAESFQSIAENLTTPAYSDTDPSGQVTYGYRVIERDATGLCASTASSCVEAQTSGSCTAPPLFAGIATADNGGTATCSVALTWAQAEPACGNDAHYAIHRGATSDFAPAPDNRIAQDIVDLAYVDTSVGSGIAQYYAVRALDSSNGAQDDNLIRLRVTPTGPAADGAFASGSEPGDPPLETDVAGRLPDQVEHAGWHPSTARFHTGTQSFWSTAANNLCVTLVTPALELSAGESSQLSFWTVWDIQSGWDGGVIDVSTDDGGSWARLTPTGGYPGTIGSSNGSLCGIAAGAGVFTGTGQFTWSPYQVDLSSYAGQTVKLRWLYRSDANTNGAGWFVDDVALTHARVPGMCVASGDAIFVDGFDITSR
ncbi:MAG: choice-of-anchor B family protein [Dokdonella sp.]|uniref:choice-of-anchor B family protein n=1 Tax=Dokdonella sp. TaxID=2291710 RepID=UPI003265A291